MRFFSKAPMILTLALCLSVVGCMGRATSGTAAQSGDTDDFTLKDLSGANVHLGDLLKTKKAVLVNFWATWCPPCREEIPGLIDLQDRYGAKGFTVLGVDLAESRVRVQSFVKKIGINYPVVLDSDQAVGERFRIVGIPTSYLFDAQGKRLGEYHAYDDRLVSDVENALK